MPQFDKSRLPSRHVSVGPERAPHRSYYYAMGLSEEEIARIEKTTEEVGKCDFEWDVELKDANGEVVAITHNVYQMRKIGG